MTTIEQLDQLAEFQAQRDLLELQKADLLNAVKVPAEVQAAQDAANKQRQALDARFAEIRRELSEQANAAIDAIPMPELPAEYVTAVKVAQAHHAAIRASLENEIEAAVLQKQDTLSKIDANLSSQTAAIFAQLEQRKREIADEFSAKAGAVDANIKALTDAIKQAVKDEGKTCKGKVFQAVYVKGRVTWNTDMLDGMVIAFPALEKARKVGEPSVTLRKI